MPLSGKEMLSLYHKHGYVVASQKGSHVKVAKGKLRQIIPMHKELHKGLEAYLLKGLKEEE